MKIVNQTTDSLVLKEGDAKAIIIGIIFAIVGLFLGFNSGFAVTNTLWIALGLFVIGLVVVFMSSSITVDLNKGSGQIIYQTKRLIGGKTSTYPISDALRIETRKSLRIEGSSHTGKTTSVPRRVLVFQSFLVFKNGQELPLDHQGGNSVLSMNTGLMVGGSKEITIANQVATFLGVPFQEITPSVGGIGMDIG
jgi:hypothetical protein